MLRKVICARPKKRRLYTRYCVLEVVEGSKGFENVRESSPHVSWGSKANEVVGESWYDVVVARGCFLSLVSSAMSKLDVKGSSSESWVEVGGICRCA